MLSRLCLAVVLGIGATASCAPPRHRAAPASSAKPAASTAPVASIAPAASVAPVASASSVLPAAPTKRALGTNQITGEKPAVGVVDVASGRPPSVGLPKGTIFVGAVLDTGGPTLFEWDVAGRKVLRQRVLPFEPGNAGGPAAVRLATATGRVYAVVDSGASGKRTLTVLGPALEPVITRDLHEGRDLSIEANERWVVVAMATDRPQEPLEITLFDAKDLTAVAVASVGANPAMTGFLRNDSLELRAGRLYVVGRPLTDGKPGRTQPDGVLAALTTVFALELPSLKVRAKFEADHAAHLHASVTSNGQHLVLATQGKITLLTDDLRLSSERRIEGNDAVFGLDGRLFTGGDREAREELARANPEHCTAAWSATQPLLVCGRDDGYFVFTDFGRDAARFWR